LREACALGLFAAVVWDQERPSASRPAIEGSGWRNQTPVIVVEGHPIQIPVVPVRDKGELSPMQWVERMGDVEKSPRTTTKGCI